MSLFLAAFLLSANPEPAPVAVAPAPTEKPAKPKKERKICRTDPATTGSMIPNRVCKTKAEWLKLNGGGTEQPAAD